MLASLRRFGPEIGWLCSLGVALLLARAATEGRLAGFNDTLAGAALPLRGRLAAARGALDAAAGGWRTLEGVRAERDRLRDVARDAQLRETELVRLREENARLGALFDFRATLPLRTRPARLLSLDRDERGASGLIALPGPAPDGPRALLAPEGVVGRTVSCSTGQCRAVLVTDPSFGIGLINERSRLLVTGEGNGTALMTLRGIGAGDDIRVGDRLLSSGLDGLFPRGLVVGTVATVTVGALAGAEATLRPAANPGHALEMLVVEP